MGKRKKDKKDKKKKKKRKLVAMRLEEVKRQRKLDRARAKARIKETETPEERRARRLAKKKLKATRREEDKSLFGYTNEDNPFRDPNLTTAFVWRKKLEKEQKHYNKQELRQKQAELKMEIEAVKARREQREIENQQMEEMKAQMQRDLDAEQNAGWEEKEEQFHAMQAQRRSEIRIAEGREKAIDILAKNLHLFNNDKVASNLPVDLDVELLEPYKIFDGLELEDLRSLQEDLQLQINAGTHLRYWNSLMKICTDEIGKLGVGMRSTGIHSSVRDDVKAMFEDAQSEKELEAIGREIQKKITNGGRGVDIPYWEAVQRELDVFQSKAFLKRFHEELLQKRLNQLKASYFQEEAEKEEKALMEDGSDSDVEPTLIPHDQFDGEVTHKQTDSAAAAESEDDFSPELLASGDEDEDIQVVDADYDLKNLEMQRRVVLEQKNLEEQATELETKRAREEDKNAPAEVLKAAGMSRFMTGEELYAREASKGLADDEGKFKSEVDVEPYQPYWWHDKYRPRKPKYFNRVKTGYDWNRYNQTHYDKENPPPKIVQGYKFNIFFPDLIDPTKPPSYVRERIPGDDHYELLRFIAGPPYEDVAFKVVRREWELSHRRGYKNSFDRGVLHLYFNFRRYFYRR